MIELSDILNNSRPTDRKQLVNLAALLASDDAFAYNPTYITDSAVELKRFKDNVNSLRSLLFRYSDYFNKKILTVFDGLDSVWGFKLQINNAVEIVSDDNSFIVVRDNYENELLKLLTKTDVSNFVLTLHLKYSLNDLIDLSYDNISKNHIQHSFKVSDKKDTRNSINQFISIVKLHLDAKK